MKEGKEKGIRTAFVKVGGVLVGISSAEELM